MPRMKGVGPQTPRAVVIVVMRRLAIAAAAGLLLAAPAAAEGAVAGPPDRCALARTAIDGDRERLEALIAALHAEDEKPESKARFRRMCALDADVSRTAGRLAAEIGSAPSACLSAEDEGAAVEMKRLSVPIPECAASKRDRPGRSAARPAPAKAQGVKTAKRRAAPGAGPAPSGDPSGYMARIY